MLTKIIFRILHFDQDDGILVAVEDDGSLPSLEIVSDLESEVLTKLKALLYYDVESFWRKKIFSNIESDESFVNIVFNFMLENKHSSKLPLIKYNKNSIELHRFVNQNRG